MSNKRQAALTEKARISSETASRESLQASVDTLHYDQRAWVFPAEYVLSHEPDRNNPTVTVTIKIVNKGRTPALDVYVLTKPSQWHKVPPDVDWATYKGDIKLVEAVLPPDTNPISTESNPVPFGSAAIDDYNAGHRAIYIRAKIVYRDIFNQNHWFTLCASHTHGTPLNVFTWCGNSIDEESKQTHKAKTKHYPVTAMH